ncbi:hypothetical protein N7449_011084, partial [Penicillium cf. viridicatum]
FIIKRYNRIINRAIIDKTCKRFLTKGRTDLKGLKSRLYDIKDKLNSKGLKAQFAAYKRLEAEALTLSKTIEAENQPMKRLIDTITIY